MYVCMCVYVCMHACMYVCVCVSYSSVPIQAASRRDHSERCASPIGSDGGNPHPTF